MSDRIDYPDKVCPVHGVPMRRVGQNYYCPVTPADVEKQKAAALNASLKWVADVCEPMPVKQ